ncbi:Histone-lysine N-methyltransferase SETMAR [Eumeta japonica]|uniref:Histone-lysine N-methyltransferase SETMAR n=1 Tax=Eumeta variegata TaxID=151549 RepID=A0A4C1VL97_EUMVA|nr:Histone-lysine N-methyltransferase SETMAR [Eumeta japonica]
MKDAAGSNPRSYSRRLLESLGPSKDIINRHLKSLGKICRSCRIVPHELNAIRAKRRRSAHVAPWLPKDERFIKRIVTCDEKWIYVNNPNAENQ